MAGKPGRSGGGNRKSDAQKIAEGTYRTDRSDEVYAARNAAKVITGVFLSKIPEPELPLGEVARKKYFELAQMLFDNNTLTSVSCMLCQSTAMIWEKIYRIAESGKTVPASVMHQFNQMMRDLKVAENAPAIANPNQKSRFEGSGFSNSRSSPYRLRSA